ncbi:hypothetical protein BGZ58_010304 [Dissophora ornata]|nr:hypothetical protein BGZ58_010304 [Dissophora ornata]
MRECRSSVVSWSYAVVDNKSSTTAPRAIAYLSYHEFVDRFVRLNMIVRPTYPTTRPNIVAALLLAAAAAATTVGAMRSGTSLATVGQGACFLLPIIIVVLVKLRSEFNERSRKKFKHQSQKLLRAWTAHDTMTHAIQWKLRLRSKRVASRWLGNGSGHGEQSHHDRIDDFDHDDANDTSLQQQEYAGTVALTIAQALQMDHQTHDSNGSRQRNATLQQEEEDDQREHHQQDSAQGMVVIPIPSTATPSPVADVYQALSINTQVAETEANATTTTTSGTELDTHLDATVAADTPSSSEPRRSIWTAMGDRIREFPCIAYFFREGRVWLIEISILECQLDEYTLTVPSPVYCDYRLPGYSDIMRSRSTLNIYGSNSGAAPAAASSSRLGVNRYQGDPPAYESESDNGSDTGDGNDDDDAGNNGSRNLSRLPGNGGDIMQRSTIHLPNGESSFSVSRPNATSAAPQHQQSTQEMTMIQRPTEMVSIVAVSPAGLARSMLMPDSGSSTTSLPLSSTGAHKEQI